jgi:hypothetical protein
MNTGAALGVLAGASLIGFDISGEAVSMHRLTRRVALDRARRDNRLSEVTRAAIDVLKSMVERGNAGVDRVTLKARINLASTHCSMGRLDDASKVFEENLDENIRVHGETTLWHLPTKGGQEKPTVHMRPA